MANVASIKGVKDFHKSLNKAKASILRQVETNLKKAGLFIQRESQKIVPVDTGNLRASAFTRKEDLGSGYAGAFGVHQIAVRVGYTAHYAIYVHENMDASHKSGKQSKFLEWVIFTKRTNIMTIITSGIKV